MNNEEKKAVETLKDLASTIYYGDMNFIESDDLKIILNLIEKQQKEIDLCEETEIALNNRILDLEEINKEHQKLNGELREEIDDLKQLMAHKNSYTKQLEEDLFENASNYVVSKDKIREKIELLLKANKLMTEEQRQKETEYMQGKLRAYEELLEEE